MPTVIREYELNQPTVEGPAQTTLNIPRGCMAVGLQWVDQTIRLVVWILDTDQPDMESEYILFQTGQEFPGLNRNISPLGVVNCDGTLVHAFHIHPRESGLHLPQHTNPQSPAGFPRPR